MPASRRRVRRPTTARAGGPTARAVAVTAAGIFSLRRSSGTATAETKPAIAVPLTNLRTADQLQRDHERLVRRAGPLLQRDLAGAVAADVGVVFGAGELRRLLGGRRRGQLRVQQPAVTGHAAAGRADRLHDLVRDRAGDLAQLPLQAEVARR